MKIVILPLWILLFINCGFTKESQELYSARTKQAEQLLVLIKLPGAPLLERPYRSLMLGREQERLISKLNKLSKKIEVIQRFSQTINALAISLPQKLMHQVTDLGGISYVEHQFPFSRRKMRVRAKAQNSSPSASQIIGADWAKKRGITGKGIRVGVIDTGIDYTHSALAGPGTIHAYESVNPKLKHALFPNSLVTGGRDFVGTQYDINSVSFKNHLPIYDPNPLDESDHGTHVAGIIAGRAVPGKTPEGIAPGVELFALKVFGEEGDTGDIPILAALEFSADPNQDGDSSDRLDIINLSLGETYGRPHLIYSEAVANLAKAGTLIVSSAGNSGAIPYITDAPGTVEEVLSVGASTTQKKVEEITDFSSQGPRSFDSLLKPEIVAPGEDIVAAMAGSGNEGVDSSGTSMAAPVIAGAAALIMQARPELSVLEVKNLLMGTAIPFGDKNGPSLSLQGAGRVSIKNAMQSPIVSKVGSISLGERVAGLVTSVKISVRNLTRQKQSLSLSYEGNNAYQMLMQGQVDLFALEEKIVSVMILVDSRKEAKRFEELSGRLLFKTKSSSYQIPIYSIIKNTSSLVINYNRKRKLLQVENKAVNPGEVFLFNLIGEDKEKAISGTQDELRSPHCDLQAVGGRVIKRKEREYFQFSIKLHRPVSIWQSCEVGVLFDHNLDGEVDQELAGVMEEQIPGLEGSGYGNFLMDSVLVRQLRHVYELKLKDSSEEYEDYFDAILWDSPAQMFQYSSVAILEVDKEFLDFNKNGETFFSIGVFNRDRSALYPDDFLVDGNGKRKKFKLTRNEQESFPEEILVGAKATSSLQLTTGKKVMVLIPSNPMRKSQGEVDKEMVIISR